ncbi:hypothetical protein DFAR_1590016 [Desulfarculales bacterium]
MAEGELAATSNSTTPVPELKRDNKKPRNANGPMAMCCNC